jgi:hypothetical protein
MPSKDPFAKEWRITSFCPPESPFFAHGGSLLIGLADAGEYDITWRDAQPRLWSITDLPLVGDVLEHDQIEVRSGRTSQMRRVRMWLELEDDNHVLKGSLEIPPPHPEGYGEGPVGTFSAHAGSGKVGVDAPRLEERIAV